MSQTSPPHPAAIPQRTTVVMMGDEARARACLPALRSLCATFDLIPEAPVAIHALSSASLRVADGDTDPTLPAPLLALAGALPDVGARAEIRRGTAEDLFLEVRSGTVCVAMAARNSATALAILDPREGEGSIDRVHVRLLNLDDGREVADDVPEPGDDAPGIRVGAGALARMLGAESAGLDGVAEIAWIVASPALPLAALSSSHVHGRHGQGDGVAHGHSSSPFARLRALTRLERDDLWVVLVYAVAVGVLSLATPIAVQALVNTVAFGALVFPIVVLALLLMAVLAFAGVLHALQMRVVEVIQQRVFTRVALDLAYRLARVRAEALDRAYGPELVNRFFDVLTVQKSASIFLLDGLSLVLSAAIGMLVLAFYHPLLLAFDVVLVLTVVVVLWGLGRRGPYTAILESKAKYRVAAWLEDLARSGATFRTPHGAALALARADELARGYLGARRASFVVVFRQYAGLLALQAVATAALLGLGGWLVVERQLTLGQLVAAELIVATVVSNLSKLGRKIDAYYDLLAAVDKLGHLVDLPMERAHGGAVLNAASGAATLVVRGLRYSYDDGTEVTMPSFTLAPHGRIAIVGKAGTGKSTIADVLFGLRAPRSGCVEVDGVDVRELAPHELRAHVALVRAEPALALEGTLASNVTLGRGGLGRAEARAALDAVGLEARVRSLSLGIETPLAATGAPLCSSDLRRLGIARALVGSPRLLLIDGGLAGLDSEACATILTSLTAKHAPWSIVVLATPDDPLVGVCDQILHLDRLPEGAR